MKKFYQTIKFKKFNSRRSSRKQRAISKKKKRHIKHRRSTAHHKKRTHCYKVPDNFSIIHNCADTINFFIEVLDSINKSKPLQIDLSSVKEITPDAIIYLILVLEESKKKQISIKGNVPEKQDAFLIFYQSGFYEYVNSNIDTTEIPRNANILTIKSGTQVDGNEGAHIRNYLKERIPTMTTDHLTALYAILIECMSNTNEYASRESEKKKWWTMALYDEKSKKVFFAFADNGVGIPATVRKRFIIDKFSSDADTIRRAVSGEYKISGSREKTRNKGLPQIKSFYEQTLIANLVFVSNNGYYKVGQMPEKLKKKFTGTMIAWEFLTEGHNENTIL